MTSLITIITATHNLISNGREKTFRQCVESIHQENQGQIEHLVIDGGSTDGSVRILDEYAKKGWFKYISEPDSGIYEAMNKGIHLAQGEYVWFINSDDYILNGSVNAILEQADFGKVDAYICGVNEYDAKDKRVSCRIPYELDDKMYFSFMVSHQGIIYKKDLHRRLGEYNTHYQIAADWDFFLRVYEDKSCYVKYIYRSVAAFRLGGLSGSNDKKLSALHLAERAEIISKHFPELSNTDCEFFSRAIWKSNEDIYKYFSNKKSETYTSKFIQALKILCRRNSLDKVERIPFAYTKEDMINKLSDLPIIEPPYKEKEYKVVLCLASDVNYEPHLYVAIKSALSKISPDVTAYIYILDGGIVQKENFYQLENQKVKISFIDMRDQFISASETRHLTRAAYYRLGIFWLFRKFDRVVYIDADSLLLDDISKLYHLDIKNMPIAASVDTGVWQKSLYNKNITWCNFSGKHHDYCRQYLQMSEKRSQKYFSSGVLILDLQTMDLEKKQSQLTKLLEKDYYSHDQDILNCLFSENEISILPRNWNYYNISNSLKEDDYMQDEEKNNYFNLMCTPSLVSFVIKPWLRENLNCDFAQSYWQYLRASPYYDVVASKLNSQSLSNNIAGKISYKLFGLFPILKIKHNSTQSAYKLLGFLPLIKIKRSKRDVISVLGLPMFRVQNKNKYKLVKFLNLLPIMKIS